MEQNIVRGSLICASLIILFIVAVFDIRENKISNRWIQVLWVIGILEMMTFPEIRIQERMLGSCYISFLMMLPNMLGKRAFGGGDMKLISVWGWLVGAKNIFWIFAYSVFAAGIYIGIRMWKGSIRQKAEIPFAPFIFTGTLLVILQHIGG